MNKFFWFIVAIIAFAIGIYLVGVYTRKNLLAEIPAIREIPIDNKIYRRPPDKTLENQEQSQEITFTKEAAGSAVNTITKERVSFMDFRSSDGENIQVNHFYVSDSYQIELDRFDKKLKKAGKVLEVTPVFDEQKNEIGKRAVFKENGRVKILKLFKVDEKEYFSKFEFYETVAPNLKYALAFENRTH